MPFELTNVPSTFQATMNSVFKPFLHWFILVFFDDILIYSPDWPSHHLQHLCLVFHLLLDNHLFAKKSKCELVSEDVNYLNHVISDEGVSIDRKKIQAIIDWPTPTLVKALCRFLGLNIFYRRFIRGYAKIATPLTALLYKDCFVWSTNAQTTFVDLKRIMTTLILFLSNFNIPFVVKHRG